MGINAILSFVIELAALVSYGFLSFILFPELSFALKVVLSFALVGIFVALWARFAAPRSLHRLDKKPLFIFKLLVLLPALLAPTVSYGYSALVIGVVVMTSSVFVEYQASEHSGE